MALKLTTQAGSEIEVKSLRHTGVALKIKSPGAIVKHPNGKDETLPDAYLEVTLGIQDIEDLIHMLRV